jgi:hypothetical protein
VEIFAREGAPPVLTKPVANLPPGVNDTGVNSTTQGCPNKIIKIFLLEGFFQLPPVANLELLISPRIFEKIRNGPSGIFRGLRETDSRK